MADRGSVWLFGRRSKSNGCARSVCDTTAQLQLPLVALYKCYAFYLTVHNSSDECYLLNHGAGRNGATEELGIFAQN